MPRIRTTVVGSYPVPDWLVASPSEQALLDATRVVIGLQEQAGIDVVCDGELYRFDINHPETNGMIEYFVRPMDGITQRFSFDDLIAYRANAGMRFRTPQLTSFVWRTEWLTTKPDFTSSAADPDRGRAR